MLILIVCASLAVVLLGVWVMVWIDAVEDAERERKASEGRTAAREQVHVQIAIDRIIRESQAA